MQWGHIRHQFKATRVQWGKPIPIAAGILFVGGLSYYKEKKRSFQELERAGVTSEGSWYLNVFGAIPLRALSQVYGRLNGVTLPEWFRVPGYSMYAWIFGVNLDEMKASSLRDYKSMRDFFTRELKEGSRPIDPHSDVVSPSDGRITFLGEVNMDGQIQHVKDRSYTVQALLSGKGYASQHEHVPVDGTLLGPSKDTFASLNNIDYSISDFLGARQIHDSTDMSRTQFTPGGKDVPGTFDRVVNKFKSYLGVISQLCSFSGSDYVMRHPIPRKGNKLFCAVVYLAPGDYHRFHSPTDWIVDVRRHFPGELFSVSPWMIERISDLLVLNERVALFGRWRHGFFSMTPVGATNVGSILINFDKNLVTNRGRVLDHGSYSEAHYGGNALQPMGQLLLRGAEMGRFSLGSTIVLLFEAPESFHFTKKVRDKVRVGEALGSSA